MISKVINFNCEKIKSSKLGIRRPEYLNVKKHALTNIEKLIKIRPPVGLLKVIK
jgi:hypothetical protein